MKIISYDVLSVRQIFPQRFGKSSVPIDECYWRGYLVRENANSYTHTFTASGTFIDNNDEEVHITIETVYRVTLSDNYKNVDFLETDEIMRVTAELLSQSIAHFRSIYAERKLGADIEARPMKVFPIETLLKYMKSGKDHNGFEMRLY